MMAAYYIVHRLNLSTVSWTDVVVPVHCSQVRLLNEDDTNAQYVRSDKGDSGSQRSLLPSDVLEIRSSSPETPFTAGEVICSILAVTGGGPVVAEFIR